MLKSIILWQSPSLTKQTTALLHVVIGSLFLAILSQISVAIPFSPIPMTLQTFALYLLILAQGKEKAVMSVVLYLVQASLGLPVLHGWMANPAWMFGPTAGYLIGFVACAYVSGWLLEKKEQSWGWNLFSLFIGQTIIYMLGTVYLARFLGFEKAFYVGVVPFLYGAVLKISLSSVIGVPLSWASRQTR